VLVFAAIFGTLPTVVSTRRKGMINRTLPPAIFALSLVLSGTVAAKNSYVEKRLQELVDNGEAPGVQYVAVKAGGILADTSAGWADIKNRTPMRVSATMHAYSMTKTITAIAVLQLMQGGKISLSDPLTRYIPDHPYGKQVTIHQLLTHTSGIPNPIPLKWTHLPKERSSFNEAGALQSVAADNPDLKFQPGGSYKYSNIGYWYLGQVVAVVSGMPYEDYVVKTILQPLGISKSEMGFTIAPHNIQAKGYLARFSFMNLLKGLLLKPGMVGEKEGSWVYLKPVYVNGKAYGGLIGSARAMATILQDLLDSNSRLLSANSKALMYSPQKTSNGESIDMTLGWHIGKYRGTVFYYKEGGGAAYRSEMRIYPDDNLASVLMLNRTQFDTSDELNRLDAGFLQSPEKQE
jgi:D-alanyl-D-alanine carboxypeptidase